MDTTGFGPGRRLPAPAEDLDNKLRSLRNLETAIRDAIVSDNLDAAGQFARIAREHAVAALESALHCVDLPPADRFPADGIRHAEQLLAIPPGTFSDVFAVNFDRRGKQKALAELLVEIRDNLPKPPADAPVRTVPSWLPAIIRVGSAVLVAAAIGAPLAALAVGEPVVREIVKAGIAVTACAIVAEVTNRVLERWLDRPAPVREPAAEPAVPPDPAEPALPDLFEDAVEEAFDDVVDEPVEDVVDEPAEPAVPDPEPEWLRRPYPVDPAPVKDPRFDDPFRGPGF